MSPTNQRQAIRANGRWLYSDGPSSLVIPCRVSVPSFRSYLLSLSLSVSAVSVVQVTEGQLRPRGTGWRVLCSCVPNTIKSTPLDNVQSSASLVSDPVQYLLSIMSRVFFWSDIKNLSVRFQKHLKKFTV